MLLTQQAADLIEASEHLDLILPPHLSVVIFKRCGWDASAYSQWSQQLLERGEGFVMPTKYQGETVLRLCIVNPTTSADDLAFIIASLI